MSQTFRSRDEQVADMTVSVRAWGRSSLESIKPIVQRNIQEAEARGAAEQRRKDAEGQEPAVFVRQSELNDNWPISAGAWRSCQLREFTVPLYARPVNAATGIDIDAVICAIGELPDRISPDDKPDILTVTTDELRVILSNAQPANVAALEARVKELEDQERKDAQVIHWLAEKLKDADPSAKTDYELIARAALTREGGV